MKTLILSIFYREWLKTRFVFSMSLIVVLSAMLYILLDFAQSVRISGVTNIVREIIINNTQPLEVIKYIPTILGLALAICQFTPEMIDRRFRLSLHLPFKEHYIMAALLSYGVLSLTSLYIVALLCSLYLSNYLPMVVLNHVVWAIYPWLLSGYVTYAIVSALIIEPNWLRKISFVPLLLTFDFVMLLDCQPWAFANSTLLFIFAIVVAFLTPFYNMIRFKNGECR
ncbi:MAG: hypothetical protein Q4C30_02595 [Bacteroidia bacterium]|nr:hypothetical protein [Bacteroidia bacterium]